MQLISLQLLVASQVQSQLKQQYNNVSSSTDSHPLINVQLLTRHKVNDIECVILTCLSAVFITDYIFASLEMWAA